MQEFKKNLRAFPVHDARTAVEAGLIQSLLESHGIDVAVDTRESFAYDGLFSVTQGYAKICVFEQDVERAERIIADFLTTRNQSSGKGRS